MKSDVHNFSGRYNGGHEVKEQFQMERKLTAAQSGSDFISNREAALDKKHLQILEWLCLLQVSWLPKAWALTGASFTADREKEKRLAEPFHVASAATLSSSWTTDVKIKTSPRAELLLFQSLNVP